ncbi:MAG TPA: TonB-dependent receptor [Polyangiaceae bacterium]|nr:TonB-dependent receptor [Polyangiaceae bacterium]
MLALLTLGVSVHAPSAFAQTTGASGETPGRQGKLTKLPKLVEFVEAEFPESEKAAGKGASVVLQIAITDKGNVEDVAVITSAGPAFDKAAEEAVMKFKFDPAEVDGKPAPVKITYRYDFTFKEEPKQPVVNYDGVVMNRFTKKPIEGAKITIEGVGEAVTDADGHFEFKEVPLGPIKVAIDAPGLTTVSTDETLVALQKLTVKYSLEPKEEGDEESDLEVVVVAPRIKKEITTTEIKAEEGRRIPGTGGDTLKVVQNLPGVARASFGSGQLVVWGAAPNDTRIYVDNVRIPLLYHGGGLRSTVNSDLVRAINLTPGGYGSEYGRGLGGLVTIDTRTLRNDRFHGYVAADAIDASAMVEAPVAEHTRVALAARKSYLDKTINAFTDKDVNDFVPIPDYYDAQFKIQQDLRQNESVDVIGIVSRDNLTRTVSNPDPAQVKSQDTLTGFNRFGITYKRQFEDGTNLTFTPWGGTDHSRVLSSFGGTPTVLDVKSQEFGLRAQWRGRLAEKVAVIVGLDAEGSHSSISRRGAVTLPPREGDINVFGQQPGDQVNADDWSTTIGSIAPYAQIDANLLDGKLHVIPGFRVEPFVVSGSRQTPAVGETPAIGFANETTVPQPRLNVIYQMLPRLGFKAAVGMYAQAPVGDDLSAVFGNPQLGVSHATHALAGVNFKLRDDVTLEETLFYSHSTDLVVRSDSPTPHLAQALVQEGEGRAYGVQLLLRKELSARFFGWISYTLMRSERLDHPGGSYRLFDYDQTHVGAIVGSYDLGAGFELGARFRYSTGYPRTPVVGSFYSSRRDLYEPIFGEHNSIRIPAFAQVDARLAKRFNFGWGKAELFVDVQNVSNRKNPEEIVYNYTYEKRGYISGLPILPVLGGRFEW